MVSRATSCRSTSVAWVCSSIRRRAATGCVHALIFTAVCQPALLRVAHVPPDDRGGDRRLRGGVGVLRRRVRDGDPRQPEGDRRRRRSARAAVEPGVRRVRAGPRVRDRSGPGALTAGQAAGGAAGAVRARLVLRRRDVHRSRRRATPGRDMVPAAGRDAHPRHDPAATRRGVRASRSSRGCGRRRASVYDVPIYATAKVHRDHHIEVAKALYSIPGNLIGARVEVRADRTLVRVFHRGQLVKVHPRQATRAARHRSRRPAVGTDRVRDARPRPAAAPWPPSHGPDVGAYATALLDIPLPWTKMRQVYALLGLVKKWGAEPGRRRLRVSAGARGGQRRAHRPHARTRHREHDNRDASRRCPAWSSPAGSLATPASSPPQRRTGGAAMTAPDGHPRAEGAAAPGEARPLPRHAPRTARARPDRRLGHAEFLELVLADEVTRRETTSAPIGAPAPPGSTRP